MDKAVLPREILLLSYFFPPYPGIGGRRWAKFAKYLAKSGVRVHVVSAENPFSETSTWLDDVKDNRNIVPHSLPPRYPTILLSTPKTFADKLRYKAAKKYVDIFSKGTPYDCAMFWRKPMQRKASELIRKHGIQNVIATGAPFYLLVYATHLKDDFPELNVICDFRDPWTDAESFLGYSGLSEKRRAYERDQEQIVLSRADHILGVADWMIDDLKRRAPKTSSLFHVIPNGFDPEEINTPVERTARKDGKIRFVSAGALYLPALPIFRSLMETLLRLKERDIQTFERLDFCFYGPPPGGVISECRDKGLTCVTFHPAIPAADMLKEVRNADFGMIFLDYAKTFTVRCVEYVGLKVPIVVFSHTDRLSKILVESGIGYGCHPNSMDKDLGRIVSDFNLGKAVFSEKFDRDSLSAAVIADKILSLFRASPVG